MNMRPLGSWEHLTSGTFDLWGRGIPGVVVFANSTSANSTSEVAY